MQTDNFLDSYANNTYLGFFWLFSAHFYTPHNTAKIYCHYTCNTQEWDVGVFIRIDHSTKTTR